MKCDMCGRTITTGEESVNVVRIDIWDVDENEFSNYDIWILCDGCFQKLEDFLVDQVKKNEEGKGHDDE